MTTKFTAGPWEVSKHATPEYAPQYGVYAENQNDHVIVKGENAKADVDLIAASPDLLEALRMILDDTNAGRWDCLPVVKAGAAIAQAEGNA